MDGATCCDGFFVAVLELSFVAFRFLLGCFSFSGAPMMGNVGPSLEYGGVAVTAVVSAPFSDGDANNSLIRFGFAMPVTWEMEVPRKFVIWRISCPCEFTAKDTRTRFREA